MGDIALVVHRLVRGDGEGRVMLELARVLLDRGHRVTVYSSAIEPDLIDRVRARRIPRLPGPDLLDDLWFLLAGSARLRLGSHGLICVKGACVVPPRPFVFYASFCHAGWRSTWTARNRPRRYHRMAARFHERLERVVWPRAARVLAVSPLVGEELNVPAERLTVVPNGVELAAFGPIAASERMAARTELALPAGSTVVAFVGEYATGRKGLEPLLHAVAAGSEHLVIAGRGPAGSVHAMAAAAGVADRVHLVGFRPVRAVLAAADILAAPSRYEPFSNAATEAAASGLPLLLSARVGAAAFLGDGAVIVEDPDEVDAIRAALDDLGDPARRDALGQRAAVAASVLDWSTTAGRAADAVEVELGEVTT